MNVNDAPEPTGAELAGPELAGPELAGTVTDFDVASGLGTITAVSGATHSFHCIEIADGTRDIAPGTAVRFELLAKFGRYEAANIRR